MPRPEVLAIDESFVPKESLAKTAAQVSLGSGVIAVIELFEQYSNGISYIDFRGLPTGLADVTVNISRSLHEASRNDNDPIILTQYLAGAYEERQDEILFGYAIGARQYLWDGAEARYDSETNDPRSGHYNFGN